MTDQHPTPERARRTVRGETWHYGVIHDDAGPAALTPWAVVKHWATAQESGSRIVARYETEDAVQRFAWRCNQDEQEGESIP